MTTNIDQDKLTKIMQLKNFKINKEAVNEALTEYLRNLNRQEVLKWRGKGWEGDLNIMRENQWKLQFLIHQFGLIYTEIIFQQKLNC